MTIGGGYDLSITHYNGVGAAFLVLGTNSNNVFGWHYVSAGTSANFTNCVFVIAGVHYAEIDGVSANTMTTASGTVINSVSTLLSNLGKILYLTANTSISTSD